MDKTEASMSLHPFKTKQNQKKKTNKNPFTHCLLSFPDVPKLLVTELEGLVLLSGKRGSGLALLATSWLCDLGQPEPCWAAGLRP